MASNVLSKHLFVVRIFSEDLDMGFFNVDPLAVSVRILALPIQPINADLSFWVLVRISAWRPDVDVSVCFVRFRTAWRRTVAVKEKIQAHFSHNQNILVDRMDVRTLGNTLVVNDPITTETRIGVVFDHVFNLYVVVVGLWSWNLELFQAFMFEAVFGVALSRQVLDADFLQDLSVLVRNVNISASPFGKLALPIQKIYAKIWLHYKRFLFSL